MIDWKTNKGGFTLVELGVVIAIIAILASVLTPVVLKSIDKAKIARTIADLKTIKQAAIAIYTDLSVFPQEGNWCAGSGFASIAGVPAAYQANWAGPYLERWPREFPWGDCVSYLRGPWGQCFDFDGVSNNDSYVHLRDSSAFTAAIKLKIDSAIDDGDLFSGVSGNCRGGLVYFIGEGSTW